MTGSNIAFLGFAITALTIGWWVHLMFTVKIPRSRISFLVALVFASGLGATAKIMGTGHWLASIASGLSIFIAAFFVLTVIIGDQKGGTGKFVLGQAAPAIVGRDENNEIFDMATLSGQPILLKFFRGHW